MGGGRGRRDLKTISPGIFVRRDSQKLETSFLQLNGDGTRQVEGILTRSLVVNGVAVGSCGGSLETIVLLGQFQSILNQSLGVFLSEEIVNPKDSGTR
jgi:hypothetical protein